MWKGSKKHKEGSSCSTGMPNQKQTSILKGGLLKQNPDEDIYQEQSGIGETTLYLYRRQGHSLYLQQRCRCFRVQDIKTTPSFPSKWSTIVLVNRSLQYCTVLHRKIHCTSIRLGWQKIPVIHKCRPRVRATLFDLG